MIRPKFSNTSTAELIQFAWCIKFNICKHQFCWIVRCLSRIWCSFWWFPWNFTASSPFSMRVFIDSTFCIRVFLTPFQPIDSVSREWTNTRRICQLIYVSSHITIYRATCIAKWHTRRKLISRSLSSIQWQIEWDIRQQCFCMREGDRSGLQHFWHNMCLHEHSIFAHTRCQYIKLNARCVYPSIFTALFDVAVFVLALFYPLHHCTSQHKLCTISFFLSLSSFLSHFHNLTPSSFRSD